jgi:HlyD family secretion protein
MKSHPSSKLRGYGKFIAIVGAALTAVAVATYTAYKLRPAASPRPSPSPSRQTVSAVAALGYLQPNGEVIHLSAPAFVEGARVDRLLVKRGETVKKGQVVAVLDSRDRLEAALQQTQQQAKVSKARLAQIVAGAKSGEISAQSAKLQVTQAELTGQISTQNATIANLEAQLQGEKAAQSATVILQKAELKNAKADCQRYRLLYASGAVSVQSRDSVCLKQDTIEQQVQEAEANLNQIIASRGKQIQAARANLKRTIATQQRQVQVEGATLRAVAEVRPVDVRVAQVELDNAYAAVKKARADLNMAYVRSPMLGQILEIHTRPGEVAGNKGIVDVGQTGQMYVAAEVYETDIKRVKIGQRATIKANGAIEALKGTVDDIGLQIGKKDVLGTDPTADTDARVVEVKIRLDPQDSRKAADLTNLQVYVVIDNPGQPKTGQKKGQQPIDRQPI